MAQEVASGTLCGYETSWMLECLLQKRSYVDRCRRSACVVEALTLVNTFDGHKMTVAEGVIVLLQIAQSGRADRVQVWERWQVDISMTGTNEMHMQRSRCHTGLKQPCL